MKTLLTGIVMLWTLSMNAQTEVKFLNALGKGNLSVIEKYMASEVTFCINDDQKRVAKGKAISQLKSFFADKKIEKFKILHNGKASNRSSSYRVARMKTSQGTYRIFAYSEANGSKGRVIEIRIDSM